MSRCYEPTNGMFEHNSARERQEAECRKHIQALHKHHPDQWRANLIALQVRRMEIESGATA